MIPGWVREGVIAEMLAAGTGRRRVATHTPSRPLRLVVVVPTTALSLTAPNNPHPSRLLVPRLSRDFCASPDSTAPLCPRSKTQPRLPTPPHPSSTSHQQPCTTRATTSASSRVRFPLRDAAHTAGNAHPKLAKAVADRYVDSSGGAAEFCGGETRQSPRPNCRPLEKCWNSLTLGRWGADRALQKQRDEKLDAC